MMVSILQRERLAAVMAQVDNRTVAQKNRDLVEALRAKAIAESWADHKAYVNRGKPRPLEISFAKLIRAGFVKIVRSKGKPPKVVVLPLVLPHA